MDAWNARRGEVRATVSHQSTVPTPPAPTAALHTLTPSHPSRRAIGTSASEAVGILDRVEGAPSAFGSSTWRVQNKFRITASYEHFSPVPVRAGPTGLSAKLRDQCGKSAAVRFPVHKQSWQVRNGRPQPTGLPQCLSPPLFFGTARSEDASIRFTVRCGAVRIQSSNFKVPEKGFWCGDLHLAKSVGPLACAKQSLAARVTSH